METAGYITGRTLGFMVNFVSAMFKTKKRAIGSIFLLFVLYVGLTVEPNSAEVQAAHLAQCEQEHGAGNIKKINKYTSNAECTLTDEYKEEIKLAKAKAEEERLAKIEEEKAIAKAKAEAFAKSPEGLTKKFVSQAGMLCTNATRNSAKFPNEVDFDWLGGNSSNYWMDFNDKGESRVMITKTGKMMNGLGMMVPFKSVCKFDYNPQTNKYKLIEFLL